MTTTFRFRLGACLLICLVALLLPLAAQRTEPVTGPAQQSNTWLGSAAQNVTGVVTDQSGDRPSLVSNATIDPTAPLWPKGLVIDLGKQRVVWTERGAQVIDLPPGLARRSLLSRIFSRPEPRWLVVGRLVAQQFPVDVPVDLWEWDVRKVMTLRAGYGYAWVPSSLNPNVQVAPGLSMPGRVGYDPAAPPVGAILVPPPEAIQGR